MRFNLSHQRSHVNIGRLLPKAPLSVDKQPSGIRVLCKDGAVSRPLEFIPQEVTFVKVQFVMVARRLHLRNTKSAYQRDQVGIGVQGDAIIAPEFGVGQVLDEVGHAVKVTHVMHVRDRIYSQDHHGQLSLLMFC